MVRKDLEEDYKIFWIKQGQIIQISNRKLNKENHFKQMTVKDIV